MSPGLRKTSVLIAAVVAALGTAALGLWQLSRADQKLALQAVMADREQQPTLTNASLPCAAQGWALQEQRRVLLSGRWLAQRTVLLDNRQMGGRPGFLVLTPFELDGVGMGSCTERWVLVQRGWLPRHSQDRLAVPHFVTPSGPVQLRGRLILEPSRVYSLGDELSPVGDSSPRIVQNVDLDALSRQWGQRLRPGAVLQLAAEVPAETLRADGHADIPLLRQWPKPAVDVSKHHAYAAQWFALSALITGLYVWFQLIRPFRQRPQ